MVLMANTSTIQVGVVVERRKIDHPWQEYKWRPVGVLAGTPPQADWSVLVQDPSFTHFFAGMYPIELHRKETAGYKYNLESPNPAIYVVLRTDEDGDHPIKVQLVKASPYDAEAYMESGDEIVEQVPMPPAIAVWLAEFVQTHHVEEVFRKRKRDKVDVQEHKFGQEPIVELRQKMMRPSDD
jgi:hypothetical protein